MIELQVELRRINRNSIQIGRDLVDPGHRTPPDAVPFGASEWKCHDPATCYAAMLLRPFARQSAPMPESRRLNLAMKLGGEDGIRAIARH